MLMDEVVGPAAAVGIPVLLTVDMWRGVSGSSATVQTYKFMVPEGSEQLDVRLGTDAWLPYGGVTVAARRSNPLTATEHECVSTPGTQTRCGIWRPEPGLWYVSVSPTEGNGGYHDMWLVPEVR
ncbi:hypothetical protein HPC49_14000 [Pyxidicoccus fallax]|uniref:Uncharacterized protein n=1 Tax=Pyxidicoccus fallax TaxID=394095 RepID=A0A848LM47_9BACT|nr:hypothetical protein [Pyxidicoccus fallax]NMO18769.1 hypothetical protein [Pyxidicoccus fallax]NPC79347.1 hypothetical protein [Pyxidicoccus fallax]